MPLDPCLRAPSTLGSLSAFEPSLINRRGWERKYVGQVSKKNEYDQMNTYSKKRIINSVYVKLITSFTPKRLGTW